MAPKWIEFYKPPPCQSRGQETASAMSAQSAAPSAEQERGAGCMERIKTYLVHIDQYHDSEPVFTAWCDELPGLAVGAASRAELIETAARKLPKLLGELGRSDQRCRLKFLDARSQA